VRWFLAAQNGSFFISMIRLCPTLSHSETAHYQQGRHFFSDSAPYLVEARGFARTISKKEAFFGVALSFFWMQKNTNNLCKHSNKQYQHASNFMSNTFVDGILLSGWMNFYLAFCVLMSADVPPACVQQSRPNFVCDQPQLRAAVECQNKVDLTCIA